MSKTLGPNAAASSSTRDRSKSFGSKLALDLKKVKSRESAMSDQAMAHQNNMPFSPPLPTAGTGASGSTAKRIRAVPRTCGHVTAAVRLYKALRCAGSQLTSSFRRL